MVCLKLKQGDTWSIPFRWRTPEKPAGLVGASARMNLMPLDGGDPVLELSSAEGTLIVDEEASSIKLSVPKEQTAGVPSGTYLTDQEVTFPDGYRKSTKTFSIQVLEDKTK